jgi:hypothetical protein
VACDLIGFFRPHLRGCGGKHYQSGADTALPAIVFAVVAAVGSIGTVRLPLLRLILRGDPGDQSDAEWQHRALRQAGAGLHHDEVLVVEAGLSVADLLMGRVPRFVARVARNFTARRNRLPTYPGRGRHPAYGGAGSPLASHPQRQDHCRDAPRCHSAVEGGWTAHTGILDLRAPQSSEVPDSVVPVMCSTRSCHSKPEATKRTLSRCINCRRYRPA